MLSEKMTSNTAGFLQTFNIGQFCNHFMRIVALWLCKRIGIAVLPEGCRAIPAGHLNFDPALAKALGGRDGVNRAIIFQYIANWIAHNEERGKNLVNGRFWSYNSARAWAEAIGLWDAKTVERHLSSMRDSHILDAQAIKAHKGDQTLWYTLPDGQTKDSNGGAQMSLWAESNAGMTSAKAPHDSSIPIAANPISAIQNPKQQQHERVRSSVARRGPTGAGVGQFPKRDLDPKEFSQPKPELRDHTPQSEDGDDERATPPPVAPPPSPHLTPTASPASPQVERGEIPDWMGGFFDGCTEGELMHLLQQFGEKLLEDARRYALNPLRKIQNPPGYVRSQLAKGWRPPKGQPKQDESSIRDYQPDLVQETDEYLEWVLSDECPFMLTFKNEARGILAARHGSAGVR